MYLSVQNQFLFIYIRLNILQIYLLPSIYIIRIGLVRTNIASCIDNTVSFNRGNEKNI